MGFLDLGAEAETAELEPVGPPRGRPRDTRLSQGGVVARAAVLAGLAGLVLAVPVAVPSVYLNVVSVAAVYGLMALSMNILVGYTGQVSLGHNAFLGIGAFAAGYTLTVAELPWAMGVVVAALTGAGAALLLGAVALRVRGLYLAIATIAYGLFAENVVFQIRPLTGGGAGMPAPRPDLFAGDAAYAYLCIAVLGVALAFDWRLTESRAGRAIHALRDDERVAASWAVSVTTYKLLAFVLSGVLAGVAGALFASVEGIVVAADFSLIPLSLTFLLMTVIGGAGNRWGVVQGGILFAILPTVLTVTHANLDFPPFTVLTPSAAPALLAVLLLLVLTVFPGGFAQLEEPVLRWLSFKPYGRAGAETAALAAAGTPSAEEGSDGPA